MIVTIFRSRLRPEHTAEYETWAARIHGIAVKMPGSFPSRRSPLMTVERVSIVEFGVRGNPPPAWRNQPDHLQAQALGRKLFYSEYHIQVCQPIRAYSFPEKTGAPHGSVKLIPTYLWQTSEN